MILTQQEGLAHLDKITRDLAVLDKAIDVLREMEQAKADVISYLIGVRNLKEIMIIELKGEFIV
ncbi:hypothetical protein [Kluyvera genomosp. 1]|uniref:hypothetical protein n=1 Tax=Kluyvera genomosp. 1 TaxID=2774053 RepID=UPI0006910BE0|nr:hypothetical protein [Kluyvera genomosp. 1]